MPVLHSWCSRLTALLALSLSAYGSTGAPVEHGGAHALVMHLNWPSQPGPFSPEDINTALTVLEGYMKDTSYGNMILETRLVQIDMPAPRCSYMTVPSNCGMPSEQPNNGLVLRDALIEAAAVGAAASEPFMVEDFDFHVVLSDLRKDYSINPPKPSGGNGMPSGKVFASDLSFKLLGHEFVHSMNVAHAKLKTGEGAMTPCPWPTSGLKNQEYGNLYDVMGSASVFGTDCHLNVRTKNYLNWLPDSRIVNVTDEVNVYTIYQQDTDLLPSGPFPTALRIRRDSTKDYWVEFRQRIQGGYQNASGTTCTTNADQGILVYLADQGWRYFGPEEEPFNNGDDFDPAQLMDMDWSEGGCDAAMNAALPEQASFCDNGITITLEQLIAATATEPAKARVRVQVPAGWASSANQMSTITFLNPPTSVHNYFSPGQVNFLARVFDPETISDVRFELYAGGESPAQTKNGVPVAFTGATESIWRGRLDLSSLAGGGYVVVVTVKDGQGRSVSNGTYFSITR